MSGESKRKGAGGEPGRSKAGPAEEAANADPETDALNQQLSRSGAAIASAVDELAQSLPSVEQIEYWAMKHPWLAIGAAAGAGFATASLLRHITGRAGPTVVSAASLPPDARVVLSTAATEAGHGSFLKPIIGSLAAAGVQALLITALQSSRTGASPFGGPGSKSD